MLANKLKIGDTIGVIAPDKALKNKDIKYLENVTNYFESLGLKVKYGKYLFSEDNYCAGTPKERAKQFSRFAFAQDKYSNGETTLQILEENIEPDKLYLLDEPEVSLSPKNQVELAKKINEMSRYLGIQFIISTHSPFMLGILDAKIYNLDTTDYRVQNMNSLA